MRVLGQGRQQDQRNANWGSVLSKKKASKKKQVLPLNVVLPAMDLKMRDLYQDLDDEQRRAFSPWMMMRYASSVQGEGTATAARYLIYTNRLVNKNFSDLSKHPELQWLLFTVCGDGRRHNHVYVKPPNARRRRDRVTEFLRSVYPTIKDDDIQVLKITNSTDDLRELARQHGYDEKEIREMFK